MGLMIWNDSFSVKIKEIDQQHQKLMEMVNDLNDAMSKGKGKEVVGTVLQKLISYTASHFSKEEKMMSDNGYPEYVDHKAKHDKMVAKVLSLQKDVASGKLTVSNDVMNFLMDWLQKHIKGTDMQYSGFLNSKGVH